MSQKHQQIRAAEPTSYPVELNYYVITTLPFIPALNRPPVTEEPSHSAPSTTLSSTQEPISSWWDAPLPMIGTPLPQQPVTPSPALPTLTLIHPRTTLWPVLRSLQQRKWPSLMASSALMPKVTSYGTDIPDNNDYTTSLLFTIANNQQLRSRILRLCYWFLRSALLFFSVFKKPFLSLLHDLKLLATSNSLQLFLLNETI